MSAATQCPQQLRHRPLSPHSSQLLTGLPPAVTRTVFSIEFKDRAVDLYLQRYSSMHKRFTALQKMLRPLSGGITGLLWIVAALNIMLVGGVDVRKYLLAVGSLSGLALGLGSQSLVSSVLSGVNLVAPPPACSSASPAPVADVDTD